MELLHRGQEFVREQHRSIGRIARTPEPDLGHAGVERRAGRATGVVEGEPGVVADRHRDHHIGGGGVGRRGVDRVLDEGTLVRAVGRHAGNTQRGLSLEDQLVDARPHAGRGEDHQRVARRRAVGIDRCIAPLGRAELALAHHVGGREGAAVVVQGIDADAQIGPAAVDIDAGGNRHRSSRIRRRGIDRGNRRAVAATTGNKTQGQQTGPGTAMK